MRRISLANIKLLKYMQKITKLDTQIIFSIFCIVFLLASIYQIFYPSAQQDGDSSGLTTLTQYFVYAYLVLNIGCLALAIKKLFELKISNWYFAILTSLAIFIFYKIVGVLIFPLLTLMFVVSVSFGVFALTKKDYSSFILTTVLPISLLGFISATSFIPLLLSLIGVSNPTNWLPEIIATNIAHFALLIAFWYKIKE